MVSVVVHPHVTSAEIFFLKRPVSCLNALKRAGAPFAISNGLGLPWSAEAYMLGQLRDGRSPMWLQLVDILLLFLAGSRFFSARRSAMIRGRLSDGLGRGCLMPVTLFRRANFSMPCGCCAHRGSGF